MTDTIIKSALALFALSGFLVSCADAQITSKPDEEKNEISASADLSTDEGVIAELQKITNRKNAERTKGDEKLEAKRLAASKLKPKNVCIERFKESPKVVVIGDFRHDYGCHWVGAFIGLRYFETENFEIHKSALDALGWEIADKKAREKLAQLWVEKGLLAFFTVLNMKPEELKNFDAHPPRVITTESGEIKVTLWVRLPSRMRRGKEFQHLEYRFKEDGNFSGSVTLDAVVAN